MSRSVPGLCDALADRGCDISFVTQKPRGVPAQVLLLPTRRVETHLLDGQDWPRLRFSHTPMLEKKLDAICAKFSPDVLHDHGVWLQMNHVAGKVTRRRGIKRVVSPRGMLEGWSLHYRGWKKRIAWRVYQLNDLRTAAAFSSTSEAEADSLRELGLTQPIAVIPNGIDLPAHDQEPERAGNTVLFMSRIHPKKGLMDLVTAWSRVARPGWRLVIAGPDENGHLRAVKNAARASGIYSTIHFSGYVAGREKSDLLRTADIFVLPTYSENFGNAIGEALAWGIPVITTKAAPWSNIASEKCGWWTETGPTALENALSQAMLMTAEERQKMGMKGRQLVERDFSWRTVSEKHIGLYDWILGRRDRPQWVSL